MSPFKERQPHELSSFFLHSLKATWFLTLLRDHLLPGPQASKAIPLEAEDSLGCLGFILASAPATRFMLDVKS